MKLDAFVPAVKRTLNVLLVACLLVGTAASCTRVTAPGTVVTNGEFTIVLHLSTDSTATGEAEFDNTTLDGVPHFVMKMIGLNPDMYMEFRYQGNRPPIGIYTITNEGEVGGFTGTLRIGSEETGINYQIISGEIEITASSTIRVSGAVDLDAMALDGPIPERRIGITGIYRAICFNNCPPDGGGGGPS